MGFKDGKFGRLTIRHAVTPDIFYCDCKCGNELEVWRSLLAQNIQLDCGMCRRRQFGGKRSCSVAHQRLIHTRDGGRRMVRTREFATYLNMINRCTNANHHAYDQYGGRGIRVCERWMTGKCGAGFANFLADMGPRPVDKTLDRINPQGLRTYELPMGGPRGASKQHAKGPLAEAGQS
jgi:hypothetical protein